MTNNTKIAAVELLLSDTRGVYIPRDFVSSVLGLTVEDFILDDSGDVIGLTPGADTTYLIKWDLAGQLNSLYDCLEFNGAIESETYWDSWDTIEQSAKFEDGHTLLLDGDLFALNVDKMTREEKRNFNFELEPIEVDLPCVSVDGLVDAGFLFEDAHDVVALIEGDLNPKDLNAVNDWIKDCYNEPTLNEQIMCAINAILDGHGVESLTIDNGDCCGDQEFSYVNMGDTYNTTVILDEDGNFMLGCWGDIAELDS